MIDLDDFLDDDGVVPESEHFRLEDDSMAEWAMRKYRKAERQRVMNARLADEQIAKVNEWLRQADKALERDLMFFESVLREYAIRCRENPDDGRKSISLPSGKVTTRPAAPKWVVNPESFLPWARVHRPDLIRIKEEPALALIKEALVAADTSAVTEDGELVPGVAVSVSDYPSVTVKPDLD